MVGLRIGALAVVLPLIGGWPGQEGKPAGEVKRATKPNVVLIVADDLGYGELGCYGGKDIPTPNIDSLARDGIRLTDGYVTCPVCAPTRAGLLTGRYGPRFGFEFNPGPKETAASNFGLPTSEKTLAERLKGAGYATGMVGKWHIGYKPALTPPNRGFDSFFGFLGGANKYRGNGQGRTILRGGTPVSEPVYLTDAFAREAADFIEKNKSRPFFLYLPFNAVHAPLQSPVRLNGRLERYSDPKRRSFAGMLIAMDEAVGRVLGTLSKNGLAENTLVVFISDNGGPTPQTTSSNGPLRGFKGQTWEGGMRIPFLFRWTGRLPAGKEFKHPAISLDIVPTVLRAAGVATSRQDKLDGVDLLPFLTEKNKKEPHETLTWRFGSQYAIRQGSWKLVTSGGANDALFDLSKDIGEKNDLAASQPDKAKSLKAKWQSWSKTLSDPKWGRKTRRGSVQLTVEPRTVR